MSFIEKDLEEILYTTDRELLGEKGLHIEGILKRQLKIGNYGIAELVSFEKAYEDYQDSRGRCWPIIHITVYELKKDKIGISAFLQAVGYVKGLQRFFEKRKFSSTVTFSIVLIGRVLDVASTFSYLPDIIPETINNTMFLQCYTYKYNVDGISFTHEEDYKLSKEGF